MYRNETVLAALCVEVVDGFADGLGDRTHGDDDVLRVGVAVVVEGTVDASGSFADLAHVAGDHVGNFVVDLVAGLDGLEVDVAVLGGAAGDGSLGIESPFAELLQCLGAHHLPEVVLIDCLDLLDFVRGAETVKEVQEGDAALDCGEMGYGRHVLGFLYGAGCEQREAGLAACHHVLMVAEDGKCVRSERAGRNVEDCGQHFACDLVHIRNHQQKALGSGVGGGEGAGLEGTVHCSRGTCLTLKFGDLYGLAPKVLLPVGSPFVDVFCHGR